jgi:hypothetical protein
VFPTRPTPAWKTLRVSHTSHSPNTDISLSLEVTTKRRTTKKCYPCARSKTLPMCQVAHVHRAPAPGRRFTGSPVHRKPVTGRPEDRPPGTEAATVTETVSGVETGVSRAREGGGRGQRAAGRRARRPGWPAQRRASPTRKRRRVQRRPGGAAQGDAVEVKPIAPGAVLSLGDVESDRAGRASDLVGERADSVILIPRPPLPMPLASDEHA